MSTQVQSNVSVAPLKLGSIKRKPKGWRALLTHQGFRRAVQFGFAAFIVYTTFVHVSAGETSETITASPEAFCPFGGIESIWQFVTSAGKTVPHTHLSNIVLGGAFLLTAFFARSAFCGWICPLGFLQDMTTKLSRFLQKRVPGVKSLVRTVRERGARLAVIDRPLRLLKYALLVWSVTGAAYFGVMVFRDYDPWAALLTIAELTFSFGLLVLIVLVVASFFVERPWCRYACPLGAIGGLVSWGSPVYLKRQGEYCKGCAVCDKACPMGIDIHKADTIKSPDCIGCLECVDVCPRHGALELKVGMPVVGK